MAKHICVCKTHLPGQQYYSSWQKLANPDVDKQIIVCGKLARCDKMFLFTFTGKSISTVSIVTDTAEAAPIVDASGMSVATSFVC